MSENNILENYYYDKEGKTYFTAKEKYKKRNKREKYFKDFEIEQGDILTSYPEYFFESEYTEPLALIIGTYTCDIQKPNTSRIQLLPIYPLEKLLFTLLNRFIQTLKKKRKKKFENLKTINNKKLSEYFNDLNTDEKRRYVAFIKDIFQFKNRYFFLLCPDKLLNNNWCFVDIQNIISLEKQKIYPLIIKYITISISSPWKEKFGSVIGSKFGKIAVDDFKSHEIREIILNQF